jgi:hypothetical protein
VIFSTVAIKASFSKSSYKCPLTNQPIARFLGISHVGSVFQREIFYGGIIAIKCFVNIEVSKGAPDGRSNALSKPIISYVKVSHPPFFNEH